MPIAPQRCAHTAVCDVCRSVIDAATPRLTPRQPPNASRDLTKRELSVLTMLSNGLTRQQAGALLVPPISPMTVKTHLDRIYAALGVRSQAGAVATAIRNGLIA